MEHMIRIVSEDEVELIICPTCGGDNVLTNAAADCAECARWRALLLEVAPHLEDQIRLH